MLNATFEPLCVVSARRAVCLLLAQKAETVVESGQQIHSERLVFDVPSVVRLARFVKVPYQRRRSINRRAVFARDENTCQYCGGAAESIDHIVPSSRGGTNTWDNVVAACRPCNTHKRDRLLSETTMRLRTQPIPPRQATWFRVAAGILPDTWEPYLEYGDRQSA